MNIWSILGIKATSDERAIKRAYAARLKITRPEDDQQAFQALREAYESALRLARQAALADEDEDEATEVPVYTAAYQRGQEDATEPEAQIYTAAYEFEPASSLAVDPMIEARRVWVAFLTDVHVEPGQALRRLEVDGELLNFDVRHCFELCAVQYCAAEGCADELRVALAEYFRWEEDCILVSRDMPEETGAMLSWLRAYRSLMYFRAQAGEDEAVRVLLDGEGKNKFLRLCDKAFTVRMRELAASIRWGHADMLHFHLDGDIFEAWEAAAERKRYFIGTAFGSFLTGMGLWLIAVFTLHNINTVTPEGQTVTLLKDYGLPAFIVAHSISFIGIGYLVFKGRDYAAALGNWLAKMVHDVRFRPGAQFGWMGVFAIASLCLFIPNLSKLASLCLFAVMLGCALAATFANSAVMSRRGLAIAAVVGVVVSLSMGYSSHGVNGMLTYMLAAYCFFLLLNRGGADLADWLGVPDSWIIVGRVTWLAGVAALTGYAGRVQVDAEYPQGMWIWLLAGMLLSRPTIQHFYAVIAAYVVRALLFNVFGAASSLASQPVASLTLGLIFIATFMSVNMVRAKTNQHQFS
ncbi:hypothetical protein [Massilia sp. TSP1-1-2]|uniref:hypothetical protein n=1 Tax=Massilia sp. TSP1-1-2 TaxID=2804649 RepID=UPI003CF956C2